MSNTELIAGARKFLATPNLGKDMARELNKALAYMWELADIAEAAEARVREKSFAALRATEELIEAQQRVKEIEAGIEYEYGLQVLTDPREGWEETTWEVADLEKVRSMFPKSKYRVARRGAWQPVESEGE